MLIHRVQRVQGDLQKIRIPVLHHRGGLGGVELDGVLVIHSQLGGDDG